MMGLEISMCSELQRDFLVRYANAAKSKSTVVVDKKSAETLIGFYVDPKPRGQPKSSFAETEPVFEPAPAVQSHEKYNTPKLEKAPEASEHGKILSSISKSRLF